MKTRTRWLIIAGYWLAAVTGAALVDWFHR